MAIRGPRGDPRPCPAGARNVANVPARRTAAIGSTRRPGRRVLHARWRRGVRTAVVGVDIDRPHTGGRAPTGLAAARTARPRVPRARRVDARSRRSGGAPRSAANKPIAALLQRRRDRCRCDRSGRSREAAVPHWFTRLPASACNVVAVASGPMAYYTGPSPDGHRGGTYYVNVGDPGSWTKYHLEVTTFHEAVPGHHMQLALAHECDLHPVVGELEVACYGEGWGLYAERLADEMGLYGSPLQRIGMLSLDSLRAARLVVDTGIHAMGWSRAASHRVPPRQHRTGAEQRRDRDRSLHRTARPGHQRT